MARDGRVGESDGVDGVGVRSQTFRERFQRRVGRRSKSRRRRQRRSQSSDLIRGKPDPTLGSASCCSACTIGKSPTQTGWAYGLPVLAGLLGLFLRRRRSHPREAARRPFDKGSSRSASSRSPRLFPGCNCSGSPTTQGCGSDCNKPVRRARRRSDRRVHVARGRANPERLVPRSQRQRREPETSTAISSSENGIRQRPPCNGKASTVFPQCRRVNVPEPIRRDGAAASKIPDPTSVFGLRCSSIRRRKIR